MRRREFIAGFGTTVAWPLAARAQQSQAIRRIGILMPFAPGNATAQERVRAFREELRKRGWASGVNLQFDERWTVDNMEQIRAAAQDLVELNPIARIALGFSLTRTWVDARIWFMIVTPGGSDPGARASGAPLPLP